LSRHNSSDTGDQQKLHPSHIQPSRLPKDRPIIKLSASLYDTYKKINAVYHAECEAQQVKSSEESDEAVRTENQGWDDKNFDYIFTHGEVINERYEIKERVGKGSFGQVVRAVDLETKQDVAIKIIKSKIPFLIQSQIEIDLLRLLQEKDPEDEQNIGKSSSGGCYPLERGLAAHAFSS
jgi:dual specificity tyrosine-phosphorylation-regulated kinase 1